MLWNRNFTFLAIANVLMHLSVYMTFPLLYRWLLQEWGCAPFCALGVSVLFGFSLFLPGVFNSYLVDAFSRKNVARYSIVLMALFALAIPYVTHLWVLAVLRMIQGALFGIALMATGSTLVIDVTPRARRNAANRVFTWAGILGLLAGVAVGVYGWNLFQFTHLLYVSAGCGILAFGLISWVKVCFRAPLDLPLCSFDRFILFRTLLPGMNMLAVPLVLGMVIAVIPDTFFYLCFIAGFLGYLLIRQVFVAPMNGRMQVLLGQLFTAGGILCLQTACPDGGWLAGGILVGLGTGFSLGQYLRMMILLPFHCERGTGYHTFQLFWQAGMMGGMLVPVWLHQKEWSCIYEVAQGISMCGFLFYQIYIHGYFSRHWSDK